VAAVPGRWATVIGMAVVALLAAASPGQAAFNRAPIDLGPSDGGSPSVVMDPAGTAHVVWGVAEDVMRYCAVPRGARACAAPPVALQLDARTSRPHILRRPQDGLLVVVVGRVESSDDIPESTWAFTSADGVSWTGPTVIGLGIGEVLDSVSLTADGQAVDLLDSDTFINDFQRAPLAGPPPSTLVNLAVGQNDYDESGELARLRNGRTLSVLGSSGDGFAYRLLTGPDALADASWTPLRRVSPDDGDARVASGRRGTFVMYGRGLLDQIRGAPPQVVRRFRGDRWARPRGLFYEVDAHTASTALVADRRGGLHAVIVGSDDSGRRACVAYARARKGRWFSRAVTLHQAIAEPEHPGRVRLAVDDRGRGVVAWATDSGVARMQRLKAGRGVTRPTNPLRRGCPGFPR
jgi:hypothetical protein